MKPENKPKEAKGTELIVKGFTGYKKRFINLKPKVAK